MNDLIPNLGDQPDLCGQSGAAGVEQHQSPPKLQLMNRQRDLRRTGSDQRRADADGRNDKVSRGYALCRDEVEGTIEADRRKGFEVHLRLQSVKFMNPNQKSIQKPLYRQVCKPIISYAVKAWLTDLKFEYQSAKKNLKKSDDRRDQMILQNVLRGTPLIDMLNLIGMLKIVRSWRT